MHNLFQDSNEAAVTEEDVIQNVQSTDVDLELKIIRINKGIEITNDALPKDDCSVWKTIKNAKGIKNQVFTLNFFTNYRCIFVRHTFSETKRNSLQSKPASSIFEVGYFLYTK